MSSWRECKLGECIEVINGYAFKSQNFLEEQIENSLPVVKIKNVANGDVNLKAVQFHLFDKSLEKYLIQKNDVLIALTGNHPQAITQVVGEASKYKLNELAFLNQRVAKIKARENMSNDFLYYFLKDDASHDYLASQSSGSANQANISKSDIENMPISLPPLEEQKAIAEVLSSLDDKIDLLHRQNQTLESLAQTLFRQWFIEEAKEEWEEIDIGSVAKINISSLSKTDTLKSIKYLDTGSLTEGKIELLQEFELQNMPSRARRKVEHNDILISTVRPNQKHYGIVQYPIENMIVSTGFCVIKCERISPYFLYLFLVTEEMTEYLHSIAEGSTSTYPSLKPSDIESLTFLLPPEDKLMKFSSYAEDAWEKIYRNQQQIQTLENLRDTLLPKLLNGEVKIWI